LHSVHRDATWRCPDRTDEGSRTAVKFLVTYGPAAQITCVSCWKSTRIVSAPEGAVTAEVVAHYKRTHVCGVGTGPWDVDDEEALIDVDVDVGGAEGVS
jgi:hypothetical protein